MRLSLIPTTPLGIIIHICCFHIDINNKQQPSLTQGTTRYYMNRAVSCWGLVETLGLPMGTFRPLRE